METLKQEYERRRCLIRKEERRAASLAKSRICVECGCGFKLQDVIRGPIKVCSEQCLKARRLKQGQAYANSHRDELNARAKAYSKRITDDYRIIRNKRQLDHYHKKRKGLVFSVVCKWCGKTASVKSARFDYCSAVCQRAKENNTEKLKAKTPEFKKRRNAFLRHKTKTNPQFRLRAVVSKTVWRALRKNHAHKHGSVLSALPYSIPQLKAHLESFFSDDNGFSWANYGSLWEIDHVIPQSRFIYTSMDSKEFRDCWALTNLVPMLASENVRKQNRRIGFFDAKGQGSFIS